MERLFAKLPLYVSLIVTCTFPLSMPTVTMAELPLPGLSLGSEKILRSCWTEEELQGFIGSTIFSVAEVVARKDMNMVSGVKM
ncbi:MAG: hypothetical protein A2Y65_05300 [Deltaproteobacteria bacterium RBG_13_52_11]|nr:MAG: hypothetical protein A2Y65_05300 [Deltaproteobacteria bacterium RBG_13_52_11]